MEQHVERIKNDIISFGVFNDEKGRAIPILAKREWIQSDLTKDIDEARPQDTPVIVFSADGIAAMKDADDSLERCGGNHRVTAGHRAFLVGETTLASVEKERAKLRDSLAPVTGAKKAAVEADLDQLQRAGERTQQEARLWLVSIYDKCRWR